MYRYRYRYIPIHIFIYVLIYMYIYIYINEKKDKTTAQPLTHYNWTPLENALTSTAVCLVCRTNRKSQRRGRGQKSGTACQEEGGIPLPHFRKSSLEEIIPHRSEDSRWGTPTSSQPTKPPLFSGLLVSSMSHKLVTSRKACSIYLLVTIMHLYKLLD